MPLSTDKHELLKALLREIERELPRAVQLRHGLHSDPELAYTERRTAALIADELPVRSSTVATTGLFARIGGGDQPPVAVRAELDGLPMLELTDAPFRSISERMHACGHDVHMAALVALARAAHTLSDELPTPLLAVFQPSEEAHPSGAEQLVREELSEISPAAIVAAHIHPELPWGTLALDPGAVNASCDTVQITVDGEATHGAYPHTGRDPVLALAQIVVALHAQAQRRIDPLNVASLTVGVLQAGTAENVIPAQATARAALRAHREEDRLALRELVNEVAAGIASAHGCSAKVTLTEGEPVLENDPEIVARTRELLDGAGFTSSSEWRSCGSDDFSFFGALAPIAMGFVGLDGADGFERRPLHHPELLPPDEAVGAVARAQAVLYVAAAGQSEPQPTTAQPELTEEESELQTGPDRLYFTESDDANELIASDPLALLIGFALDQQVSVQKAFIGPLVLKERLGSLDPSTVVKADLEALFSEKPAIHRFPGSMAKRVHELVMHVLNNYDGDAARVWTDPPDSQKLRLNLEALPGFGDMKVESLAAVLAKHYQLQTAEALVPEHPTLGDVDSLEALADYKVAKRIHKEEWWNLQNV